MLRVLPSVVVSNVFSDRNRGGAAITDATISAVLRAAPGAEIALIPVGRDEPLEVTHPFTRRSFPDARFLSPPLSTMGSLGGARSLLRSLRYLAVPRRGLPEALAAIERADAVVSKGGHVFVNRRGLRHLLSLWSTSFPVLFAARRNVPVVLYAQSFGPYLNRSSRVLNRFLLRRATLILARDRRSYDAVIDLGVDPARVREMPDSVFALDPPSVDDERSTASRLGLQHRRFAAISVRRFASDAAYGAYASEMVRLIQSLLADATVENVALVVQSLEDVAATRHIADLIADHRVTVCGVDEELAPMDLLALYGAAKFTVATRMHSSIFSFVAGTPAIGISAAGEKAEGVFEGLGCGHRIIRYERVDADRIRDMVSEVLTEGSRERLRAAVDLSREAARFADDELRRAIDGRSALA